MAFNSMLRTVVDGHPKESEASGEGVDSYHAERRSEKPHVPSVPEFLNRFRDHAEHCISNAYIGEHEHHEVERIRHTHDDAPEDVYSLVNIQVDVIHEYLVVSKLLRTEQGDAVLLDSLLSIIRILSEKQMEHRTHFLLSLEGACATANDFYRMMEHCDDLIERMKEKYVHIDWDQEHSNTTEVLMREASNLLTQYGNDAVFATQNAHLYVMRTIKESTIPVDLFSKAWEDEYTNNEVAISIVKTSEDFLFDFYNYLSNEFLYRKTLKVLIRSIVCFYVRTLLRKADQMRGIHFGKRQKTAFINPKTALCRMMYDIQVLQTYFLTLVQQLPSLARTVENELSVLVVLHELLGVAAGEGNVASTEELLLVLHKRTGGDVAVTRHLMRDIWLLAAPKSKRYEIEDTLSMLNADLQALSAYMAEVPPTKSTDPLWGLRLEEALKDLYQDRISHDRSVCGVCVNKFRQISPRRRDVEKLKDTVVSIVTKPLQAYHKPSESSNELATGLMPKIIESRPGGEESHKTFVRKLERNVYGSIKLHNISFMKGSEALERKALKRSSIEE
eukprot:CAMPEP_0116559870 /NCGR_PEP_ID=MMETSP0397-20121206/10652_1 /TAXON_ID=216820 /ORGANISM="Cyclophora tenuis, Strain ECT3854" /LENGTH=559 /DNA_ID=CAMNT_0004085719 /DNA_START=5 /DNA_END=1685 /DNA_ORIENTATION=+